MAELDWTIMKRRSQQSMLTNLLVLYSLALSSVATTSSCYYGKHPSVAAQSCSEVLDVQKECIGESGYFWLTGDGVGGQLEYVYCDMKHQRGGWRRAVYFHSNINTTCPGTLVTETVHGNEIFCTKRQDGRLNQDYDYFTWNNDQKVKYSEVRGYVTVKVKGNHTLDGWSNNWHSMYENANLDGVDVLVRQIGTPFPDRPFFSYVVAQTGSFGDRCPENGGTIHTSVTPSYRDGIYACDEVDLSGAMDSEGFYTQVLFSAECAQCPAGSPWFQQKYADAVKPATIWIRVSNADDHDEKIYFSDIELYVR